MIKGDVTVPQYGYHRAEGFFIYLLAGDFR
jgi:hypothetical protein